MVNVVEIDRRDDFLALEGEWNELVQRTTDAVYLRHEFFRALIDSFAQGQQLRLLISREEGKLTGILPLVEVKKTIFGLPTTQLSSIANPHFTRFDMICDKVNNPALAFLDHLSRDGRWDLISLEFVPEDGSAKRLYDRASENGFKTARYDLLRSPYGILPETPSSLRERLPKRFRSNLERQRRQLGELGTLEIERISTVDGLNEKLEAGFAVEGGGWKGKAGTAISSQKSLRHFFSDLAMAGAARGYLSLYFLKLNGKVIAFQFGLSYKDCYLLLKPGYDEIFGRFGPGQLLVEDVLIDCIHRGLREFDLLGADSPWKLYWADRIRVHERLFIFKKSAYGNFLWGLRFKAAPAVRQFFRRKPRG